MSMRSLQVFARGRSLTPAQRKVVRPGGDRLASAPPGRVRERRRRQDASVTEVRVQPARVPPGDLVDDRPRVEPVDQDDSE